MPFRFIHTADVHLDSPLRSLALKNPEAAELVANATRTTFVRIIDLCIEEQVDALLIAGDLYDGELTSMKTAMFFASEMERLTQAGVQAFVLRGNHDAESKITRHIAPVDGVHVFSSRGDKVVLDDKGVVLHGLSFSKPHVTESLLNKYKPAEPGMINIGLLHTSLAGSDVHDPYSPCSVAQLHAQGYTYWALGHIHKREVHGVDPSTIVMPGIPQGRHINESGPRSVTLVSIDDDHKVTLEERHTSSAQFERVQINVTGCEDWEALEDALNQAFLRSEEALKSGYMIARVTLIGVSVLAGSLRRRREELDDLIALCADRAGQILIEETTSEVNPLPTDASRAADLSDPLSELGRIVAAGLDSDSPVVSDTFELIERMQGALPSELRQAFEELTDARRAELEKSAAKGAQEILARLEVGGESY